MALSSVNEDWCGFYELIWELNSKYPAVSRKAKVQAARPILLTLLGEGLIKISYVAQWIPADLSEAPPPGGRHRVGHTEYVPVEGQEATARIDDNASWQDPGQNEKGSYFAFTATPAGEKAYFSLSEADFADL